MNGRGGGSVFIRAGEGEGRGRGGGRRGEGRGGGGEGRRMDWRRRMEKVFISNFRLVKRRITQKQPNKHTSYTVPLKI